MEDYIKIITHKSCEPCQELKKLIMSNPKKYSKYKILDIDESDEATELVIKHNIYSTPTAIYQDKKYENVFINEEDGTIKLSN